MYYIRVDMQYKVENYTTHIHILSYHCMINLSRQRAMELIYDKWY